jgi:hypothetical protein
MGGLSYYEITNTVGPTPTPTQLQPAIKKGLDMDAIHFIIIYMIALFIMSLGKLQQTH